MQLNGSRKVIGVLRGYDVFLNIVLDDAVEERDGGEKERIGTVVVRGNSVVMLEVRSPMLPLSMCANNQWTGTGTDKLIVAAIHRRTIVFLNIQIEPCACTYNLVNKGGGEKKKKKGRKRKNSCQNTIITV